MPMLPGKVVLRQTGSSLMRLTLAQHHTILETTVRIVGPEACVYLFGSRLDDRAKGGDIDLLVETPVALPLLQQAHLQLELETRLGLPVDIVPLTAGTTLMPFQRIAQSRAVFLGSGPICFNNTHHE